MISVIIPSKRRPSLQRAIISVQEQTVKDTEILVEYSPDMGGCPIISKLRNQGIAKAGGEWIAFLDDDDYWHPDYLEKALAFNADVIISNNQYQLHGPLGDVGRILSNGSAICVASAIVVKTALVKQVGGFDESLPSNEVYDLLLKLYLTRCSFAHNPTPSFNVNYIGSDHASLLTSSNDQISQRQALLITRNFII